MLLKYKLTISHRSHGQALIYNPDFSFRHSTRDYQLCTIVSLKPLRVYLYNKHAHTVIPSLSFPLSFV